MNGSDCLSFYVGITINVLVMRLLTSLDVVDNIVASDS